MTDEARQLGAALRAMIAPQPREHLYAVLDGARGGTLASEALEMGLQTRMLFVGPTAPHMVRVAPYLVAVRKEAFLTNWARRWGTSTGILLACEVYDFDVVWEHMRGLFIAQEEGGNELFFRFFDPRVLRGYLPTCTAEEAREFFGVFRCLLVEDADPANALLCTPGGSGVDIQPRPTGVSPGEAPQDEGGEGAVR